MGGHFESRSQINTKNENPHFWHFLRTKQVSKGIVFGGGHSEYQLKERGHGRVVECLLNGPSR